MGAGGLSKGLPRRSLPCRSYCGVTRQKLAILIVIVIAGCAGLVVVVVTETVTEAGTVTETETVDPLRAS